MKVVTAALVALVSTAAAADQTPQQLQQLVAPIALYPDQVLSQVLMAATYPQQVVEAAQWLKEQGHGDLQGDALAPALEPFFAAGGYACDPDPDLTPRQADANWVALVGSHLGTDLRQQYATRLERDALKAERDALRHQCEVLQQTCAALQREGEALKECLAQRQSQFAINMP